VTQFLTHSLTDSRTVGQLIYSLIDWITSSGSVWEPVKGDCKDGNKVIEQLSDCQSVSTNLIRALNDFEYNQPIFSAVIDFKLRIMYSRSLHETLCPSYLNANHKSSVLYKAMLLYFMVHTCAGTFQNYFIQRIWFVHSPERRHKGRRNFRKLGRHSDIVLGFQHTLWYSLGTFDTLCI